MTSLTAKVAESIQFLDTLRKKPQDLVNQLSGKIADDLKKYKKSHPKNPIEIRTCLYRLDDKLNFIKQANEAHLPKQAIQIQYLKLCALVQEMYDEVNNKGVDPGFVELIEHILESTHIGLGADLPDTMRTAQTATTYRRELRQDHDLFPNASQLREYEKKHAAFTDTATEDEPVVSIKKEEPVVTSKEEPVVITKDEPVVAIKKEPVVVTTKEDSASHAKSIEEQYEQLLKQLQKRTVVTNTLQNKIDLTVHAVDAEVTAKKRRKEVIDYHFTYNYLPTYGT